MCALFNDARVNRHITSGYCELRRMLLVIGAILNPLNDKNSSYFASISHERIWNSEFPTFFAVGVDCTGTLCSSVCPMFLGDACVSVGSLIDFLSHNLQNLPGRFFSSLSLSIRCRSRHKLVMTESFGNVSWNMADFSLVPFIKD